MIVVLLLLSKLALYIVQEHTYITLNQSDPNRQSSKFVKFCLEICTFCHIRNKCFRRIEVIIEPIISINLISFPTYVLLFFLSVFEDFTFQSLYVQCSSTCGNSSTVSYNYLLYMPYVSLYNYNVNIYYNIEKDLFL
jgi:hypothetical protein